MSSDKFTKYMTWIIDIALIIITVLFSKYHFLFKALIICGVIIGNKYVVNATIKNINVELKKLKLKEFKFLGTNPKIQIIIEIISLVTIYFMVIYFIMSLYDIGTPIGIWFFVAIILIFINSLYGPKVEYHKLKDETIFILYTGNKTGTSILGRRVGSYEEGIIIDSFIFSKDEILYSDETSKGFTIVLTERRKIVIKDKKAKVFLKETLK